MLLIFQLSVYFLENVARTSKWFREIEKNVVHCNTLFPVTWIKYVRRK